MLLNFKGSWNAVNNTTRLINGQVVSNALQDGIGTVGDCYIIYANTSDVHENIHNRNLGSGVKSWISLNYIFYDSDGIWKMFSSDDAPSGLRIKADHVDFDTPIGTPTYKTAQDLMNIYTSPGRISGGELSENLSFPTTYDIAPLTGMISPTDNDTGPVWFFDLPGTTANPTVTDSLIYVGVVYNGGNPQFEERPTDNWDLDTEFGLGAVINVAGNIAVYSNPWWTSDAIANITERFQSTGMERDQRSGGLMLGESGTRNITVTAGQILDLLNEHPVSALDTSVSGDFVTYYYDGSQWVAGLATQWPNTQYNDTAAGLASVGSGEYANLWFYATVFNRIVMLYGQAKFDIIADASTEAVPTFLPPDLLRFGILIGRIVFQGSNNLSRGLNAAFDAAFINPITNAHNNLSGLQGGQALQYYHLTAQEYIDKGTVRSISFVNTSGFTGEIISGTTTAVLRAGTSVNGIIKGDGASAVAAQDCIDYISSSGTCTLYNKRIVKRVVSLATSGSCTPTGDSADVCIQSNIQISGSTFTINTPTGIPFDSQDLILQFTTTNTIVFSWSSVYIGCTSTQLPAYSSGQSKTDIFYFRWNASTSRWQIINAQYGF